jgi:hypothetical protein
MDKAAPDLSIDRTTIQSGTAVGIGIFFTISFSIFPQECQGERHFDYLADNV